MDYEDEKEQGRDHAQSNPIFFFFQLLDSGSKLVYYWSI